MNSYLIRRADQRDADVVSDIQVRSWRDAYASVLDPDYLAGPIEAERLALWSGRLRNPPEKQIVQIAEGSDRKIVGFVCAHLDDDACWGSWIDNLHVLPDVRGKRIGEQLMRSAAEIFADRAEARGFYLWAFEANKPAIRFYERLGGNIVGQRRSQIPAASEKVILRMHWPSGAVLSR